MWRRKMENTAITLISVGLVFMKYSVLSSRDSSVGIATRHGLDGPGIESRWRRDFPHPYRPALVSTQPLIQMDTGSTPLLGLYDLYSLKFTFIFSEAKDHAL